MKGAIDGSLTILIQRASLHHAEMNPLLLILEGRDSINFPSEIRKDGEKDRVTSSSG
jgi:hypothetical protein